MVGQITGNGQGLPGWAKQLSESYLSGTFALFVLHGNVRDLVPAAGADSLRFLPLPQFLNQHLFAGRDLILGYDRGGGLSFAHPDMQTDFLRALQGYDQYHGTSYRQGLPRNPDGVLSLLDNYLRLRLMDQRKIALVIDYAETIVPAGELGGMPADDRNSLVILKRWAQNPAFLRADVTICLIAENRVELNQGIVQHPGVSHIFLPLPDERDRQEFIGIQLKNAPLPSGSDVTEPALVNMTAGLKRLQIQSLLSHSIQNQQPLTMKFLTRQKKELIEAESGGMLEFIQSRFDLTLVAGHQKVKQKLQDAAAALRAGKTDILPMGYMISGPVGTGKTFLTTCFAGEVGIPAVTLKNFRSMWQGVTEGNLERVLNLLRAMSPIVVIVDEADAQLGDRSSSGDSGVNNRVFAQIAQFMGNTENRGRVIWFLLTCRPDLLPVDLKRQGRAEEHLALFYPDSDEDRLAMFRAMQKKTGATISSPEAEAFFLQNCHNLSGADIEAVLIRARLKSVLENDSAVGLDDIQSALADFIPASYPLEIELQNLVAVLECTSRSLLPEKYLSLDRGEIINRVRQLTALLER
jgi:AAA+ superfamily predicted ATPase